MPFVFQLGYYYDDWYITWAGFTDGAQRIIELQSSDRPFQGYEYAVAYALLGESPLGWHILIFALRLIATIGLWVGLRKLLPRQKSATFSMALLFGVYPGFTSQPHASMMHTLMFGVACGILMISTTLVAYNTTKRIWKIILLTSAFLFGLGTCFMFEWMLGFVFLLGIFLVYQVFADRKGTFSRSLIKLVQYWLPSLFALAVFIYWRLFIFVNLRSATSLSRLKGMYLQDPFGMGIRLLFEWIKDIFEALCYSWVVPAYNLIVRAKYTDLFLTFSLALIGTALFYYFIRRSDTKEKEPFSWKPLVWLGLALTAIGVLLPVFSHRDIRFETIADRYTLVAMVGVAIFWVSILFTSISPVARSAFLSVFVFAGIFAQVNSAVHYRNFWNEQTQLWWQLAWRAPDLHEDTVLFASLPSPHEYADDYEVWAPANFIYNTNNSSIAIKANILNNETFHKLASGIQDERNMRTIYFTRNYRKSIILSYPTTSACLRVLDSNNLELSPLDAPLVAAAGHFSNPKQIIPSGKHRHPMPSIFGPEPEHGWCYYYQKASLARQNKDWQKIVDLHQEAIHNGFAPTNLVEWMPFLEAHLRLGHLDEAKKISGWIKESPEQALALCSEVLRIGSISSTPLENIQIDDNTPLQPYYCRLLLD